MTETPQGKPQPPRGASPARPFEQLKTCAATQGLIAALSRALVLAGRRLLPPPLVDGWRLRRATRSLAARDCPLCGFHGPFRWAGAPPRVDALCPRCESFERHRLFALALEAAFVPGDLLRDARVLHFAPEAPLARLLLGRCRRYETAELAPGADLQLDIEALALPDASVDILIANHVLEHVDDRRAASEVFRVLKAGGLFLASVPIVEGWSRSYENLAVQTAAARTLHFGQDDHVRFYGRDFRERILEAGFLRCEEYTAEGEAVIRYGLLRGEKLFSFHKPAPAAGAS